MSDPVCVVCIVSRRIAGELYLSATAEVKGPVQSREKKR